MSKDKFPLFLYDDFEEAVFKFENGTGKGNYCTVKFKGKAPYKIECTTNLAYEGLLRGEPITEKEFNEFK